MSTKDEIVEGTGCAMHDLDSCGIAKKLQERIASLEARLEIDSYYVVDPDNPEEWLRKERPVEERDFSYDGISCRDETIKLQDDSIYRAKTKIEWLREENRRLRALLSRGSSTDEETAAVDDKPSEPSKNVKAMLADHRRHRKEDAKRFRPGSYGCHEVMHMASYFANEMGLLSEHMAITQNKEWNDLANAAAENAFALYQAMAAVHLDAIDEYIVETAAEMQAGKDS